MVRPVIALILLFGWPHVASSERLTPGEAIELVQTALEDAGIHDAQPVAPSRSLPDCSETVSVNTYAADWSTVTLGCNRPFWKRSIRTRGQMVASPSAPASDGESTEQFTALGLAKSLPKGSMITSADLVPVIVSDLGPDQIFINPNDLIGRRLDRSVGVGTAILARHLEPDWKVLPGQVVIIITRGRGIAISMQGRSTMHGAVGDIVSVENIGSGRLVSARVLQEDIVEVTLKPFENGS